MNKKDRKLKRKIRVRAKVKGTKERPRLSVFRSNRFIYVQVINDVDRETILGVSDKEIDKSEESAVLRAKMVGTLVAKKAKDWKIKKVVFDKGHYAYHGRVRAVAEGAREGGLEF